MKWIVMGLDECGHEFRPSSEVHFNTDDAYREMALMREQYEEARSFWVEEYKDKAWYFNNMEDY